LDYKKIGVILLWIVLLSSFFVLPDDSTGGRIGRIAFFVTAIAHIVEFFIYRPALRRAKGSLGHHFVQVLIFGMFHYQDVQAELAAENRGPS
jgi:uncharacterized protein YhhL (DUF1145 family)